jgi:hypothetical protein
MVPTGEAIHNLTNVRKGANVVTGIRDEDGFSVCIYRRRGLRPLAHWQNSSL